MTKAGDKKSATDMLAHFIFVHRKMLIFTGAIIAGILVILAVMGTINDSKKTKAIELAEKMQELFSDYSSVEDESGAEMVLEIDSIFNELTTKYAKTYGAQRAYFIRASMYYDDDNWEDAASAFRLIGEKFPTSYLAVLSLMNSAAAYEEADDYENAYAMYQSIISGYPKDPLTPKAYFSAARINESREDTEAAKELYRKILMDYPTSNWTKFARTRILQLETE